MPAAMIGHQMQAVAGGILGRFFFLQPLGLLMSAASDLGGFRVLGLGRFQGLGFGRV